MACNYCANFHKYPKTWELGDMILVDSQKYTFVGDGKLYNVPFRYCQNCGARLVREYGFEMLEGKEKTDV